MTRAPIMIMAGGTGGHVYPALAIAEAMASVSQPVVWLGTRRGLEARVVPQAGIEIEWVSISGLRGNGVIGWLLAPFRLLWAIGQSLRIMHRVKPRLVIGMGGFVSGPGGIAARLRATPLIIHEQNAVAGLTNRWLAKIAQRVMQGFDGAFASNTRAIRVGNPVRREISNLPDPTQRFAQREGLLRVLVIGGSQGALVLNQTVPQALAMFAEDEQPELLHQAGNATIEAAQDACAKVGLVAEITPYIEDMSQALGWADLIICRAGALTVAEVTAAGLGAIFIPFPAAVDDHQTANAQDLVNAGAALLLPQSELSAQSLFDAINTLGPDRQALLQRALRSRELASGDAVSAVLAQCADVLGDTSLLQEVS